MRMPVYVASLILVAHAALGQSTTSSHEASKPIIRSTSALVIVPTLVQSASGEPVANLDAGDFRLTDNGIDQKLSVEQAGNQRLAVVVLMQTGGAASSQLQNYTKLDTMLESRPSRVVGARPKQEVPARYASTITLVDLNE